MQGKPMRVRCLETGQVFESEVQASQVLGVWATHICNVCNGDRKTTGGLHFEFADYSDRLKALTKKR